MLERFCFAPTQSSGWGFFELPMCMPWQHKSIFKLGTIAEMSVCMSYKQQSAFNRGFIGVVICMPCKQNGLF